MSPETRPWGSLRPHAASVHVLSHRCQLPRAMSQGLRYQNVQTHLHPTHVHTASTDPEHRLQAPWLLSCGSSHTRAHTHAHTHTQTHWVKRVLSTAMRQVVSWALRDTHCPRITGLPSSQEGGGQQEGKQLVRRCGVGTAAQPRGVHLRRVVREGSLGAGGGRHVNIWGPCSRQREQAGPRRWAARSQECCGLSGSEGGGPGGPRTCCIPKCRPQTQ